MALFVVVVERGHYSLLANADYMPVHVSDAMDPTQIVQVDWLDGPFAKVNLTPKMTIEYRLDLLHACVNQGRSK